MWNIRCQFRTCPPFYVWLNLVEFWSILWFLLLLNGRLHGMSFPCFEKRCPWGTLRPTQGNPGTQRITLQIDHIENLRSMKAQMSTSIANRKSQNMFEAFYLNLELVSNPWSETHQRNCPLRESTQRWHLWIPCIHSNLRHGHRHQGPKTCRTCRSPSHDGAGQLFG